MSADITLADDGWTVAGPDLLEAYRAAALGVLDDDRHGHRDLRVVYTPLHGVGGAVVPGLLEDAGFGPVHVVAEQAAPDPAFPTVAFPNPEEPGAMDLALALAAEVDSDLVIANDPDADRLALAAPVTDADGVRTWRMLSGDAVGTLLGAHAMPALHAAGRSAANSVVSSPQLAALAEANGVRHHVTLTGFKWISRAPDLGFGYEEALGYCVDPDMVRDKDGITAALMAAELAAALTAQGRGLMDALADVDAVTGAMPSAQVSVRVADLSLIARTMTALRQQAPATLAGEPVTVRRDLAAGGDGLPPTDALLFATDSGTRVLVRPSGTEPKLKCYLGTCGQQESAHAAGLADASGRHVWLDELHGVVDRHTRRHRATRRVNVKMDVLVRVFRFKEQQLRTNQVSHVVLYRADQKNHSFLEQARVDVIGAFATSRLLDNHRDQAASGLDIRVLLSLIHI